MANAFFDPNSPEQIQFLMNALANEDPLGISVHSTPSPSKVFRLYPKLMVKSHEFFAPAVFSQSKKYGTISSGCLMTFADAPLHRLLKPFGKAAGTVNGRYRRARIYLLESSRFNYIVNCEEGDRGSSWFFHEKESVAKEQPIPPAEKIDILEHDITQIAQLLLISCARIAKDNPNDKYYGASTFKLMLSSIDNKQHILHSWAHRVWEHAQINQVVDETAPTAQTSIDGSSTVSPSEAMPAPHVARSRPRSL